VHHFLRDGFGTKVSRSQVRRENTASYIQGTFYNRLTFGCLAKIMAQERKVNAKTHYAKCVYSCLERHFEAGRFASASGFRRLPVRAPTMKHGPNQHHSITTPASPLLKGEVSLCTRSYEVRDVLELFSPPVIFGRNGLTVSAPDPLFSALASCALAWRPASINIVPFRDKPNLLLTTFEIVCGESPTRSLPKGSYPKSIRRQLPHGPRLGEHQAFDRAATMPFHRHAPAAPSARSLLKTIVYASDLAARSQSRRKPNLKQR
jgi:hypothetical protein